MLAALLRRPKPRDAAEPSLALCCPQVPVAISQAGHLIELAHEIDPQRANDLEHELEGIDGAAAAVLLATAFPPLTPKTPWQCQAVSQLMTDGWRVPRRRADLLRRVFSEVGDLGEREAVLRQLRRFVWGEKARIALRELLPPDLGGAGIPETARELSLLAEVAFEVMLAEAMLHEQSRFGPPVRADGAPSTMVVVGMGKLGGLELNAGSDVDVQFVYDTDEGESEIGLHEHWSRVARRVVAGIDQATADGCVWRVDLRLRPEGSSGPIANSLTAAERYYETWGRLWERAALLRARIVAGDPVLGEMLHRQVISPFVYRRNVGPSVATSLAELVQRSRLELCRSPARDLKLGPGGIREAEFFVQALQLIWGGREPSLRVPGTLDALARLQSRGLVTDREARLISDAYLLLRRVEHRIQWTTGIQTHLLPEQADELARIARTLGLEDERALAAELAQARAAVAELFASLAPQAPRPPPRYHLMLTQLGAETDPSRAWGAIDAELESPEVVEHLVALTRRPDGLFGELTRERYPALGDRVLDAIAGSPDPEQAVRYLRAFFGRFVTAEPYLAILAEDERAVHRLVSVLGASTMVGDAIVSHPDLADIVLFEARQVSDPSLLLERELAWPGRSDSQSGADEQYEAVVSALRRAKRRITVEVAVADLAGAIELRRATRLLSDLADEVLQRTVMLVQGDQPRGLAVIAMGKLGGRDIGYGSDLDVIFIYDPEAAPPGADASTHFIRVAQRIVRLLSTAHPEGSGYDLDTRLRPSGSQGMLVTSLGAFARYHNVPLGPAQGSDAAPPSVVSSGAAWERQALLRARPCAGDLSLGEQVLRVIHQAAYERGAPDVRDMHRMRLRMQKELGREQEGRFDLKTGQGGLLDIEFAAQWLQMRFGFDGRVRTTDTLQALEALFAAGYLAAPEYETLRDGYSFLRRLEQRIHVLHGAGSSIIDRRAPGLFQLARRMGFYPQATLSPAELLISRYREVTRAVRRAYLDVLRLDEED